LQRLDDIKSEGNDMFRKGLYSVACDKYNEVLNEISYLSEKEIKQYKDQLDELEMLCRLNIANVKLKNNDFEYVIRECSKVLKKNDKNFKAHYRCGVGYYKTGNYIKASLHFNKAREINKNEEKNQSIIILTVVDEYLKECNKHIDTKEDNVVTKDSHMIKEEEKNQEKSRSSKRDKIKDILVENDIKEQRKEDITIDEDKNPVKGIHTEKNTNDTNNSVPNIDKEKLNQAKSQILNMVIFIKTVR